LDVKNVKNVKNDRLQIENKLHYRKDLIFGEDRSTIRAEHGPENMSALRNFAISLLSVNKIKNIKRCISNLRYQPPEAILQLLF
jgi:predicted transposase YbfD/YdcC